MRKACIELVAQTKIALLLAGDLGTGRCLLMILVSKDMDTMPTTEQWLKAYKLCEQKAVELKYDVTRVRGRKLAGL